MNKYNARRSVTDGISFDSKAEQSRYCELKVRQAAGEISGLEVHPQYRLEVNGVLVTSYKPDFRYTENGMLVVEDVKSKPTRTRDYVIRKKLMKALFGIDIREICN